MRTDASSRTSAGRGSPRRVAFDVFDDETGHALATHSVELARERGALGVLPLALNYLAIHRTFEGDLDAAEALVEEADAIADATGARTHRLRESHARRLPGRRGRGLRARRGRPARGDRPRRGWGARPSASTPARFSPTASAGTRRHSPPQRARVRGTS